MALRKAIKTTIIAFSYRHFAHRYARYPCFAFHACRFAPIVRTSRSICTSDGKKMSVTYGATKDFVRELYPEIQPYQSGFLRVSDLHEIYYEQAGNAQGNPVVYLHGGPGGGTSSRDRRYFDPSVYRIILLDQRGCGQSRPSAELKDNNTWSLVEDIEKLREHLKIESWVVFGGSWGSTLSLAYSETFPKRVKALILRGIFMLRREELLWFYQEGASFLFPDFWEDFLAPIPEVERGDLISAYYRRLTGENEEEKLRCAKAWSTWEMATGRLYCDPDLIRKGDDDKFALQFARIECHFFVNGGFFQEKDQILKSTKIILEHKIPTFVVQGRYDVVCPMRSAWDLYRAMPNIDLHVIADAGHSAKEDGICSKLIHAADQFKDL